MNIFIPTHWTARKIFLAIPWKHWLLLQSSIDYAIDKVGSDLGFTLKPEQKINLLKFASGCDVLFPCQLVMENPCALFYCLSCLML